MIKEFKRIELSCDRCEKEIKNGEYFTILIEGHSTKPGISTEAACRNANNALRGIFGQTKHYCLNCVRAVEKVMKG